ncbi:MULTISPECIES: helix-turn-helix domain-containing protein [unclassified Lentimicrobium]|uniref:helix-turn-helix domain-containing protein n=1 Tax=unclassified Lentimicrobium TaxID=2677434 RepID=UPI0020A67987|nr:MULTISPECIES: helix-turn-helix domain-containing protein [unclassified Lentimicrobium]
MLSQGYGITQIGQFIGKDKSVISRELARNSDGRSGVYDSELAHRKYKIGKKRNLSISVSLLKFKKKQKIYYDWTIVQNKWLEF